MENDNITKSNFAKNRQRKAAAFIVAIILILAAIAAIVLNQNQSNNQNNRASNKATLKSADKTSMPIVDQVKLKNDYEKDIKAVIADLDKKILEAGGIDKLDSQYGNEIRNKIYKKLVPKEYKDAHIEIVLMLDEIIGGDFEQAKNKMAGVKIKFGI